MSRLDVGAEGPVRALDNRRLLDPELGGGGLLDIGIYPVALMNWGFEQSQPSQVGIRTTVQPFAKHSRSDLYLVTLH